MAEEKWVILPQQLPLKSRAFSGDHAAIIKTTFLSPDKQIFIVIRCNY